MMVRGSRVKVQTMAADGSLSRWPRTDDGAVSIAVPVGSSTRFVVSAAPSDGGEILQDDYPLVNVEPMGSTTDE